MSIKRCSPTFYTRDLSFGSQDQLVTSRDDDLGCSCRRCQTSPLVGHNGGLQNLTKGLELEYHYHAVGYVENICLHEKLENGQKPSYGEDCVFKGFVLK